MKISPAGFGAAGVFGVGLGKTGFYNYFKNNIHVTSMAGSYAKKLIQYCIVVYMGKFHGLVGSEHYAGKPSQNAPWLKQLV